jgi:hypothetical protein
MVPLVAADSPEMRGHELVTTAHTSRRSWLYEEWEDRTMKTLRLTPFQRDALLSVVNERIAGGVGDLRDALGLDDRQADRTMAALERVVDKLLTTAKR